MPDSCTPAACAGLAAIVPCYNAGARLRTVVERLCPLANAVVVVDDGSRDGCMRDIEALPVRRVVFPANRGKGHALLAGFREALTDPGVHALAVLDADGQHDPAELPGLYAVFQVEHADLLIGQRVFDPATVPWASRIGNRFTAAATVLLLGRRLPDTQCGYRIISRAFAAAILESVPGGRYETEMRIVARAVREGRRIATAPVRTLYEPGNASSHFRKGRDSVRVLAVLALAALARLRPL